MVMAKSTSFTLTPDCEKLIADEIEQGRYVPASKGMHEGLRLAWLRAAIAEGAASRIAEEFDFNTFIAEIDDMVPSDKAA
jgi:putative addiction module CopG family antidote